MFYWYTKEIKYGLGIYAIYLDDLLQATCFSEQAAITWINRMMNKEHDNI